MQGRLGKLPRKLCDGSHPRRQAIAAKIAHNRKWPLFRRSRQNEDCLGIADAPGTDAGATLAPARETRRAT